MGSRRTGQRGGAFSDFHRGRHAFTQFHLIDVLGDWREAMLCRLRRPVKKADPGIDEEWKRRGVPVWAQARVVKSPPSIKFSKLSP